MASLGEAVVDIGANTAGFQSQVKSGVEKSLASASASMKKIGKSMTSAGGTLTRNVTLPIVGAGVAVVKMSMDFEASMNKVAAITGASGKDFASLRAQARELGATTQFSAGQAADAMTFLGMAGFKTDQIIGAMPGTLSLAAASGMDLATTADIMSNVLTGYGEKAENAGKVSDIMAKAVASANTDMLQLGDAMKYVAPVASGAGLSLEQATAAIGLMSNAGIQGSMAGTALRGAITRLVNPTKQAQKAMDNLGLSVTDAKGNLLPFDDIVQQLGKSNASVADYMKIFGQRAGPGMKALVDQGAGALRQLTSDLEGSGGTAKRMADTQMKGLRGSLLLLKSAAESLAISIGDTGLLEGLTGVATKVAEFVQNLSKSNPTMLKMGVIFAAIAAAAGPLLIIIGSLISAVGTIAGVFAGVTVAIAAPIAAIVAIVAVIGLLLAKSKKARSTVTNAFAQIKAAVMPAISEIAGMFTDTFIPAFEKVWPVIQKVGEILLSVFAGAVVGVIKGFVNIVTGVFRVLEGAVLIFKGIFTGNWSAVWEGIKTLLSGVLSAIIGIFQVWLNVGVLGIFRKGFGLLKGIISGAWNGIKALFKAALGVIKSGLSTGTQLWLIPIRAVMKVVTTIIRVAWNGIKAVVKGAIGIVRSVVSTGFNALKAIVRAPVNALKGIVTTGFNGVLGVIKGIPGKIKNLASTFLNAGLTLGKKVIDGIGKGLSKVGGFMSDIGGAVKRAINSALHLPFKIKGPGPLPDFTIPAFARGTNFAPGGVALVGERGPELVNLPRGSRVLPATKTERLARPLSSSDARSGSGTTYGDITVTISVDDLSKMDQIKDFLAMLDRARVDSRRTLRSGITTA